VAVNLVAPLAGRRGDALADALRAAEARGFRLAPLRCDDDRLAAWIDATFAPSWWSSEVRTSDGWVAETAGGEIAGFAAFGSPERIYPWLRAYRDRPDIAVFGPFGVAPEHRKTGLGTALLDASLASLARSVPAALIPAVAGERLIASYVARAGATVVDTYDYPLPRARAAILASGSGTNAQAVIDAVAAGRIALDLHVVANAEQARVRERARAAGIGETAVVWRRGSETRAAYDARVIEAVAACEPDLVLLLGWMHLLPAAFLERFPETLNVHPAFLPFDPTGTA
jgi:GNAT superfamily N-acetyltransferase